ncbi:MAG: hypothetical protein ACYC63_09010 [Armatimonadota bacterium]
MRRVAVILLVLSATAVAWSAPVVPNLVPDPSFEARSWQLGSWEVCEYKNDWVADTHDGGVAAHLNAIKPGKGDRISALVISKAFPVIGGQDYLLSLWYKTGTADRSPAALSILSYKEPFTAKGFKTPSTGYVTVSLPPSVNWRQWTMRYHMPNEAVETVLMPRVTAVGELWVDDVSMAPAGQAEIKLSAAGQIASLPDQRRYAGTVTAPEGLKCELQVYSTTADKPIAVYSGKSFDFEQKLAEGQSLQAYLVDPATRTVYAAATLPAPPLVEFSFTSPSYRRNIYASCPVKEVGGQLKVNATPQLIKNAKATWLVMSGGVGGVPGTLLKSVAEQQTVRQPIPQGATGKMTLQISVQVGGQTVTREEPFAILPAAPKGTREVTVGPNNELLMDGKPFFARGFMGGNPEVYEPVVKAGYNVGMTFGDTVESATKFMDGCQRMGMFMVTGLPNRYMTAKDPEGLREAIRKIRNHPALLGYYFPDEPSPSREGLAPEDFAKYYQIMLEEDPYHPVMTTLCQPELTDDYAPSLDLILLDPYPVTKSPRPLTMVSDWLLRARELVADRKPVWFVPQTFGGDVIEGCPASYSWLTPSPEQERCMIYLGLAVGAQGLLPYCYHVYTGHDAKLKEEGKWPWTLGGYLPEKQPALWASLAQVGTELQALAPALTRPSRMWQEKGLFLREIAPAGAEPGYLIAVNASETKPVEAKVTLQTKLAGLSQLKDIDEKASAAKVAGGNVSVALRPMQVGVYVLPGK